MLLGRAGGEKEAIRVGGRRKELGVNYDEIVELKGAVDAQINRPLGCKQFWFKTEGLDFGDLNGVQIQPGAKTHEYGY